MMNDTRLLFVAVGGVIITALCCFTPLLVLLLGAAGLSAWLGWLDYLLLPMLGLFIVLSVYAFHRWRKGCGAAKTMRIEGREINR